MRQGQREGSCCPVVRDTLQGQSACTGYLDYPFEYKQGKSCMEHLAHDVEKEKKMGVMVIISVFLLNGYSK